MMKHDATDEAPIVRQIRQAQSVSESHDNGRETAPFDSATDTTIGIVTNAYDANGRGHRAVQGA